jgi:hypothetical protein
MEAGNLLLLKEALFGWQKGGFVELSEKDNVSRGFVCLKGEADS